MTAGRRVRWRDTYSLAARTVAAAWGRLRYPNAVVYLGVVAAVCSGVGVAAGNRLLLPLLDTVALAPVWLWAGVQGRCQSTALTLCGWFAAKVAVMAAATVIFPHRAAAAVLYGPGYAAANLRWLGAWELPAGVVVPPLPWIVPALTAAVAGVTAGFGGITIASVAANCQGYYLGLLLTRTTEAWRVAAFGYTPWLAFGTLGLINLWVAAAEPTLSLALRRPLRARELRNAAAAAVLMLVAAYVAYATGEAWWRDQLGPSLFFGGEDGG